jgi:hypothetical protein
MPAEHACGPQVLCGLAAHRVDVCQPVWHVLSVLLWQLKQVALCASDSARSKRLQQRMQNLLAG